MKNFWQSPEMIRMRWLFVGITLGIAIFVIPVVTRPTMVAETPTIIPRPTPTYGFVPQTKLTIQLVQSWCVSGQDEPKSCEVNHFRQIADNVVLYTTTQDSKEYFNIREELSGVVIARLERGGAFKVYPYWDITTPSVALHSGETILFAPSVLMDRQGRIVDPQLPEGTQP